MEILVFGTPYRLWPHLGRLRYPVMFYLLVISFMLACALSVNDRRVYIGAALFYLSGLFVARQRFVFPEKINAMPGLPLYYLDQYLIASSVW